MVQQVRRRLGHRDRPHRRRTRHGHPYDYLDGAAWHYDDDDGLTKEKYKTWSQWRGYGHVRVRDRRPGRRVGHAVADRPLLPARHGRRPRTHRRHQERSRHPRRRRGRPDHRPRVAGRIRVQDRNYSGPGGKVLAKTVNRPWHHQTAKKVRDWGTVTANLTGTATPRRGPRWTTARAPVADHLDVDTLTTRSPAGSPRSTTSATPPPPPTTAAPAPPTPPTPRQHPGRCPRGSRRSPGLRRHRRPRQGRHLRRPHRLRRPGLRRRPDQGRRHGTATLKKHDGTTATYLESGATYDSYGRPLTATDLTADVTVPAPARTGPHRPQRRPDHHHGLHPATGFADDRSPRPPRRPTPADATTAQTTTTTFDPLRGLPLDSRPTPTASVTDSPTTRWAAPARSGWPTGRTARPPATSTPTRIVEDEPVAVGTQTLEQRRPQITAYTFYDGFLRPRQTQAPGPGRRAAADRHLLRRTRPDGQELRALLHRRPAAGDLFEPENALSVETQTRHSYDGLGRETGPEQIAGNGDGGAVLSTTTTIYGGDRTTVIPPAGGPPRPPSTTPAARPPNCASTTPAPPTPPTTPPATPTRRAASCTRSPTRPATPGPTPTTSSAARPRPSTRTRAPPPAPTTTAASSSHHGRPRHDPGLRLRRARPPDRAARGLADRPAARQVDLRHHHRRQGPPRKSIRYDSGNAYTSKVVTYDRLYRPCAPQ